MKRTRMAQAAFALASLVLAATAHASYGQMRLDGAGLFLAFVLLIGWGLVVDVVLAAGLFRHKAVLVAGVIGASAVILLFLGLMASPNERAGFFKAGGDGGSLFMVLATSAVFLPFIVIAPFGQYLAVAQGRRSPRWIAAWIGVQVALLPGFVLLAWAEEKFRQRDYVAGVAVGREVRAGGFGALLERADRQGERIWGTPFPAPGKPSGGRTGWMNGLAKGLDASAPIVANEPLGKDDLAALQTLIARHFGGYASPTTRTKLLWDELRPGTFHRHLARGANHAGVASEEVLPLLLDRLERDGAARLCPGGRMRDDDRAVLRKAVMSKVGVFEEARVREQAAEAAAKKEDLEMSEAPFPFGLIWKALKAFRSTVAQDVKVPDWSGYPQRVERLCSGPA